MARSCASCGRSPYSGMTRCRRAVRPRRALGRAPDLGGAGQEDEHVAVVPVERAAWRGRTAGSMKAVDGRAAGRSVSTGCAASLRCGRRARPSSSARTAPVERGGHDEDAQVRAQQRLRLEREGEAEVGVDAALVELVEDDDAGVVERRVVLQHPREHALRDDLDARARSDARIEAHAVADGVADVSPSSRAMYAAAARAASRRGSSMTMRRPPSHGSSSSASGTRVVLPAPGGACSTTRCQSCGPQRTQHAAGAGRWGVARR
jgi:hypothetical protein